MKNINSAAHSANKHRRTVSRSIFKAGNSHCNE